MAGKTARRCPGCGLVINFYRALLVASRAACFYLAKLFWPVRLAFIYPRWEINPGVWWQWLFPTAVVGGLAGLWLARGQIGKGPLVAALFFVSTLSPALGFVNVYPMRFTFVADHYQYLACIGPMVLFAGVVARFSQKWRMNPAAQYAPALLLLPILATLTWRQAGIYRNSETVWRDTLAKNPACWLAHTDLGWVLTAQGKLAEAESHYLEAIRLKSDNEDASLRLWQHAGKSGPV